MAAMRKGLRVKWKKKGHDRDVKRGCEMIGGLKGGALNLPSL